MQAPENLNDKQKRPNGIGRDVRVFRSFFLIIPLLGAMLSTDCPDRSKNEKPMPSATVLSNQAEVQPTSTPVKNSKSTAVPEGNWGGNGIRLTVGAKSSTIELACADAEIPQKLFVSEKGDFSAEGFYTRSGPGPTRKDSDHAPAKVTGNITKDSMTLKIAVLGENGSTEEFRLERGKNVRLIRCL